MKNHRIGRRELAFLVWPVTWLAAVGTWLWTGQTDAVSGLVGAAVLILVGILWIVWLSRARAARRLHAVMDAYAEREINGKRAAEATECFHP